LCWRVILWSAKVRHERLKFHLQKLCFSIMKGRGKCNDI
jgi:hypothetical protein